MRSLCITFVILGFATMPTTSSASGCNSPEVAVFFGNGMFNSKASATDSRNALKRILKNKLGPSAPLEIRIAYNLNEFALTQLLQVASQKK